MKSTRDLRAFLIGEMQNVADDKTDLGKAKAFANLAQQIYNTVNIELKAAVVADKLDGRDITPVRFDV